MHRYDLEFHECGIPPRYTVKARRLDRLTEGMVDKDVLTKMDEKIQAIKKAALESKEMSGDSGYECEH